MPTHGGTPWRASSPRWQPDRLPYCSSPGGRAMGVGGRGCRRAPKQGTPASCVVTMLRNSQQPPASLSPWRARPRNAGTRRGSGPTRSGRTATLPRQYHSLPWQSLLRSGLSSVWPCLHHRSRRRRAGTVGSRASHRRLRPGHSRRRRPPACDPQRHVKPVPKCDESTIGIRCRTYGPRHRPRRIGAPAVTGRRGRRSVPAAGRRGRSGGRTPRSCGPVPSAARRCCRRDWCL